MINVSNKFKQDIVRPAREVLAEVDIADITIPASGNLKSFTQVESSGGGKNVIGNVITGSITVEIIDKLEVYDFQVGDTIVPRGGIPGELITFKTYYADEVNYDTVKKLWTLKGKDILTKLSEHTVSELDITYPITFSSYLAAIAAFLDIEMGTTDIPTVANLTMTEAPNFNASDKLSIAVGKCAEALMGNVCLDNENKLSLKGINNAEVYSISPQNYSSLSVNNNSINGISKLVLSRYPVLNDDVVAEIGDGDKVLILQNNPFIDSKSFAAEIKQIWANEALVLISDTVINGFTLKWRENWLIEPCDSIRLIDKEGQEYPTTVLNFSRKYNGGLSGEMFLEYEEQKLETQAITPDTLRRQINETALYVDKVKGEIIGIVQAQDSEIKDNYNSLIDLENKLELNAESTLNTITRIGGSNYIKDSAWFKGQWEHTDGANFTVQHDTEAETETDCDAIMNIKEGTVHTNVSVVPNSQYTIAFKYGIDTVAAENMSSVAITDGGTTINLLQSAQETATWTEVVHTFTTATPTISIALISTGQRLRITDIRLTKTDVSQEWSPYYNELYSATLLLDSEGLEFRNNEASTTNTMDNDSNIIRKNGTIVSEVSDEKHYGNYGQFETGLRIGDMEIKALSATEFIFIRRND